MLLSAEQNPGWWGVLYSPSTSGAPVMMIAPACNVRIAMRLLIFYRGLVAAEDLLIEILEVALYLSHCFASAGKAGME